MRVFLTGANGWVGSAIVRDLLDAGHSVTGLVRSKDKGEALAAAGGTPLLGSLRDLDVIRDGAGDADGAIHTAFGLDLSKIAELAEEDRAAIEVLGEVFAGSKRPIVVTSGLGLLPAGETFTEHARPSIIPGFPRASEQTAFALAERGLLASVVRLSRIDPRGRGTPWLRSHACRHRPREGRLGLCWGRTEPLAGRAPAGCCARLPPRA